MIKRVPGRSRQRGKARVIGRVCLASASHQARTFWMETMFLVVGLAIAGVVGIAAAFYFSIRSGGDKRRRPAGAGRAGADRRPGSRNRGTARPDRTDNARRAANGSRPANTGRGADGPSPNYRAEASTGPNPVLDFGDPVLVGGRRGGPDASAGDPQATDPRLTAAEGGRRGSQTRPGRVGAWASAREPMSMRNCGRRSRSAASATSSSGMTWRRTSRSPRPRAPPSRILGPGTGLSMRCRRPRPGQPAARPSLRPRRLRLYRPGHPARPEHEAAGPGGDPARPG